MRLNQTRKKINKIINRNLDEFANMFGKNYVVVKDHLESVALNVRFTTKQDVREE